MGPVRRSLGARLSIVRVTVTKRRWAFVGGFAAALALIGSIALVAAVVRWTSGPRPCTNSAPVLADWLDAESPWQAISDSPSEDYTLYTQADLPLGVPEIACERASIWASDRSSPGVIALMFTRFDSPAEARANVAVMDADNFDWRDRGDYRITVNSARRLVDTHSGCLVVGVMWSSWVEEQIASDVARTAAQRARAAVCPVPGDRE